MLQAIKGGLQATPEIDGIYTLNAVPAISALRATEEVGKAGKIMIGTADLSNEVLEAIKAGQIAFAMDQQPYLQGFLSIQTAYPVPQLRSPSDRPRHHRPAGDRQVQRRQDARSEQEVSPASAAPRNPRASAAGRNGFKPDRPAASLAS